MHTTSGLSQEHGTSQIGIDDDKKAHKIYRNSREANTSGKSNNEMRKTLINIDSNPVEGKLV